MAGDKDDGSVNYVKAAFHWQYNWITLAGAAGFAVISGSGLPLLLAAGLELIYLSTVPQNPRFQRLVRSWQYAAQKREQQKSLGDLFRELPPEMRSRYARLDAVLRPPDPPLEQARLDELAAAFSVGVDEKLEDYL